MRITFKKEIRRGDIIDADSFIKLLLSQRGINAVDEFLHPPAPEKINLEDFGFAKQWKKTAAFLEAIWEKKGMIIVYSDYDADGITGAAILWETLTLCGFKSMPYVPHRQREGYGFSKKGIDAVKEKYNPDLIISVDHGITAADKISYAKKIGIPVIVTDHHLKPEHIPTDAFEIFHIPVLSGSGVAYYFAKQIYNHISKKISETQRKKLDAYFKGEFATLAAIGTIADLVPLTGPSRSLVKQGLHYATSTKRLGLREILRQAGIENKPITPFEVGFVIAPRINAVGRLEDAIDALRLLCTTDIIRAKQLAQQIDQFNKTRQDMVKDSVEEAIEMVKKIKELPPLLVLKSDHWHEGVIGLIASKLTEKYYRPTIIMTKSNGFYKASARSIPSFHITHFLRDLKKYLVDVGGHAGAAGFTIEKHKIANFIKTAQKEADKRIKPEDLERIYEADVKIPISKLTLPLVEELEVLQPFGMGNPQPYFVSEITLINIKILGKTGNHLKLFVIDKEHQSFPIELMYFGAGKRFSEFTLGTQMTALYTADINRWNGTKKLSGRIITLI